MPRCRRCRYPNCHGIAVLPMHYCTAHASNEQAYLQSRQKWAHKSEQYGKRYNRYRLNNVQTSEQYNFYRSRLWTELRQQALERDYFLCQYCNAQSITTNARTVDHIIPIRLRPTKKTQLTNLATICRDCHQLKTQAEYYYYPKGMLTPKNIPSTVNEWVVLMLKLN